jgi:hypothetical protein
LQRLNLISSFSEVVQTLNHHAIGRPLELLPEPAARARPMRSSNSTGRATQGRDWQGTIFHLTWDTGTQPILLVFAKAQRKRTFENSSSEPNCPIEYRSLCKQRIKAKTCGAGTFTLVARSTLIRRPHPRRNKRSFGPKFTSHLAALGAASSSGKAPPACSQPEGSAP